MDIKFLHLIYNIFVILLGLITGSFLNVLIPRIRYNESGIIKGRSKCPDCKQTLQAADLIPVVSYLILKGRCRYCEKPISIRYPLIELTTALVFLLLSWKFLIIENQPWLLPLYFFYGTVLIFIFFYDLFYLEISDLILLPSIVLAFLFSFFENPLVEGPVDSLLGAAIPVIFFLIQIIISQGKWVGGGDLRIGAFMGLILGWQLTIVALVLAYLIGSLAAIPIIIYKKVNLKSEVPFGPFLALSTLIAILWGQQIIDWYIGLVMLM